jgi:hypothetical protein
MPNEPDYEGFKITTNFTLTELARKKLEELTKFYGLKSRSDLLEKLARGLIPGVLWLKPDEMEVNVKAIDFFIQEHRKIITQEEEKGEAGDKEIVLLLSIEIAHLRLIRYRLTGDAENAEYDNIDKVYKRLKEKKKERFNYDEQDPKQST